MSSASADPNGKQAKPAASTSHERARKKVCNCLVIDVLPPQRRFTELCRRLSEQATLRDCCNIESDRVVTTSCVRYWTLQIQESQNCIAWLLRCVRTTHPSLPRLLRRPNPSGA